MKKYVFAHQNIFEYVVVVGLFDLTCKKKITGQNIRAKVTLSVHYPKTKTNGQ